MKYLFSLLAFSLILSTPAFSADMASAVGNWVTIDDETGKPKSVVKITQVGNELRGSIVKLLDPTKQNAVCDACKGANKGKPIKGMIMMWGLKPAGAGWAGGRILDPSKGKIYKAKMNLIDGGKKLNVRGFIGFALIGRTQTWNRQ
ncbi:MAG: DUF2147 domain-containing protein [Cocleimonas sp.]